MSNEQHQLIAVVSHLNREVPFRLCIRCWQEAFHSMKLYGTAREQRGKNVCSQISGKKSKILAIKTLICIL